MYYKVVSSEATASRSCFPYRSCFPDNICTIKWPVLANVAPHRMISTTSEHTHAHPSRSQFLSKKHGFEATASNANLTVTATSNTSNIPRAHVEEEAQCKIQNSSQLASTSLAKARDLAAASVDASLLCWAPSDTRLLLLRPTQLAGVSMQSVLVRPGRFQARSK